jgi:hypothetical protein
MADIPEFQLKQYALAAHLRDPENSPAPAGIEDRRMAIYRRLFHNNLVNLLSSTFPVVRELFGDKGWRDLVRTFMIQHKAHTPYFPRVPGEFLEFLQANPPAQLADWPFLLELAHYEWIELAVSIEEDTDITDVDSDGDLLTGIPRIAPHAEVLEYRFPVHRISPDFLPTTAPDSPTCLVVHRRPEDSIGFLEVSPMSAELLRRLRGNEALTGQELLRQLARDAGSEDTAKFLEHGLAALEELRAHQIIIGTRIVQ